MFPIMFALERFHCIFLVDDEKKANIVAGMDYVSSKTCIKFHEKIDGDPYNIEFINGQG